MKERTLKKVISGGQSGADRAALEAAFALGLETGGWAPRGFITSKGAEPLLGSKFHLKELELDSPSLAQMYVLRSRRNVDDADATVAFRLRPSVGTDKTIGYCQTRKWMAAHHLIDNCSHRQCLVITNLDDVRNAERIRNFIMVGNVVTLNVVGHRDEVVEGFSAKVQVLLMEALE